MAIDPMNPVAAGAGADALLRRLLAGMSIFTMLMTIPQVYTIWFRHQAAGVSVVSWSAYLLAALLWFVHGLRSGDRNIYLACIGWVVLDAAVVAGCGFIWLIAMPRADARLAAGLLARQRLREEFSGSRAGVE